MSISRRNRREFLAQLAGAGLLAGAAGWSEELYGRVGGARGQDESGLWNELPGILRRIRPPEFRDREWNILKFGAAADNKTDCTGALHDAIAACHANGGGNVIVPEGEYVTGAVHLLSGVNLHLKKGATLRFTPDPHAYPLVLTRWEGTELMNYSPLIYAFEQENIGVTGGGTLDGSASCEHWWRWTGKHRCGWKEGDADQSKDRNRLHEMGESGTPVGERVFGEGHYLRPQFLQPYRCQNVLLEGVTLRNSPMWHVHPVLCKNVIVRRLTIDSDGPNTDGCDPESCADVLIEECTFNTGDDCIAIKSGRNADGRRLHTPSENIVVRGCQMKNGHGGVTLGSEISGGVRNVFAENCHMDSPHLDSALRMKNNAMRGGVLERISARNITVGQVASAGLSIDFEYEEGAKGNFTPMVRNVDIRKLTVEKTKYALFLRGLKDAPIEDVRLTDCVFANAAEPSVVEDVKGILLRDVRINGTLVEKIGGQSSPAGGTGAAA